MADGNREGRGENYRQSVSQKKKARREGALGQKRRGEQGCVEVNLGIIP
jgi:hypothetical protein